MNRKSRKSRTIRKASLVLGTAVAALSIGVPTALGEGRMAGTQESDGVAFFQANETSTLAQQNVSPISTTVDSSPYQLYAKYGTTLVPASNGLGTYPDASERASAVVKNQPGWYQALVIRGEGLSKLYGPGQSGTANNGKVPATTGLGTFPDASERGLSKLYGPYLYGAGQTTGLSSYKDGAERAVPQPQSPNITPTTSDNDIQWPQIGVGILIALFLALGIGLAVRTNRMRPAH